VLAKLVAPQAGEKIADPACGSGSLLIEAAQEVGSKNVMLYGQEVNGGTHVLVFDRRREAGGPLAKRKDVLFIDASREFQPAKTQNVLLEEQIEKIVDTFKERTNNDKYSRNVPLNEISDNDFNLNIPRYIDTFEAEKAIDITVVQSEITLLEGELIQVKAKMKDYLKELGVDA
jgi:type I restriction enzyme M protein